MKKGWRIDKHIERLVNKISCEEPTKSTYHRYWFFLRRSCRGLEPFHPQYFCAEVLPANTVHWQSHLYLQSERKEQAVIWRWIRCVKKVGITPVIIIQLLVEVNHGQSFFRKEKPNLTIKNKVLSWGLGIDWRIQSLKHCNVIIPK